MLYKPKPCLINPIFKHILLKLGEKASQHTCLCLNFDSFTLRYTADLALNSTVSSQIVKINKQDKWCSVEFIFKMAKRRADEMNVILL